MHIILVYQEGRLLETKYLGANARSGTPTPQDACPHDRIR
ncbi:unnamed protein product [Amoebophrya sp. A25]|nr:unnamed protein product [Amoebophrya sp. A25]|eukprot:GSA25T00019244001.1